jgi:CDP-glucose 4,6-dehydratase
MLLAEKLASDPALKGRAFNFSNETQVTVMELVDRILKLMDSDLEPEVRCEAVNEIRKQYLCAETARQVLGWNALFSLDDGLRATISWYREFIGAVK